MLCELETNISRGFPSCLGNPYCWADVVMVLALSAAISASSAAIFSSLVTDWGFWARLEKGAKLVLKKYVREKETLGFDMIIDKSKYHV